MPLKSYIRFPIYRACLNESLDSFSGTALVWDPLVACTKTTEPFMHKIRIFVCKFLTFHPVFGASIDKVVWKQVG